MLRPDGLRRSATYFNGWIAHWLEAANVEDFDRVLDIRQGIHQEFSKLAEKEFTEIDRQLGET